MPPASTLTLIVKVTRRCNLRCDYCHDWRAGGPVMAFPVLARLCHEALRAGPAERVEFVWHGGEPLLAGRDFFRRALALQDLLARPEQRVRNTLQTNATRLDEAWCRFFADHLFALGVSLDGPRAIHDRHRVRAGGRGSFDAVVRGLRLLRAHDLRFGVLVVLTEEILALGPARLFELLVDELGVRSFSLLPVRPDNPGATVAAARRSQYVTVFRYTEYMKAMFDLWYGRDDPSVHIREIESLVRMLLAGSSRVCTLGGGCLGHYYLVDVDGEVQHCDKFLGEEDWSFGNIRDLTFAAIAGSARMRALRRAEARARLRLRRHCPWYAVCGGGCPHDRHVAAATTGALPDCCGMAGLIAHIAARLERDLRAVATARTAADGEESPALAALTGSAGRSAPPSPSAPSGDCGGPARSP